MSESIEMVYDRIEELELEVKRLRESLREVLALWQQDVGPLRCDEAVQMAIALAYPPKALEVDMTDERYSHHAYTMTLGGSEVGV